MIGTRISLWGALAGMAILLPLAPASAQQAGPANMTFFVTSVGSGKGADLGGLEGADRHCQALAQAAGATGKTWRAYLSTQGVGGATAINARDRIGQGRGRTPRVWSSPKTWPNCIGANTITKQSALTESRRLVNGRGDTPNMHDMLTGSQPDGTAFAGAQDQTCGNWTKSGTEGAAMLGHHDRMGTNDDLPRRNPGTRLTRPAAAAARTR